MSAEWAFFGLGLERSLGSVREAEMANVVETPMADPKYQLASH
jgi:hypothetical protein